MVEIGHKQTNNLRIAKSNNRCMWYWK